MPGINLQYGNIPVVTRTAVSTTVGGNAEISTSEFVFGNASLRTFANASQVTMTNAGGILSIGTNNFTIELRVRPVTKATSFPHIIANFVSGFSSNQWVLCDRHNAYPNNFSFWVGNANAGAPILVSTTTVANDTWYAISITRSGNTWRMFINGTLEATTTTSASLDGNSSSDWYFSPNNSVIWYNGYVDEVRVSNIDRYTANYTPATSAFTNDANTTMLLHCDGTNGSKSLPDDNISILPTGGVTIQYADIPVVTRTAITTTSVNSAQVSNAEFVFGNGSALFSSVNSAITVPNTGGVLNLGTADFTIEFRYRPISKPTAFPQIVFGNYTGAMSANNWAISDRETAANKFAFVVSNFGGNSIPLLSTTTPVNGNWYAVAVTRSGSTLRMFVDGVLEASQTFAGSIDGNSNATRAIGTSGSGTNAYINGYVDELRFSNIARYTANYTIATQPFTNDANTTLLLHMDGANASTSFPDDNISILPTGGITITY